MGLKRRDIPVAGLVNQNEVTLIDCPFSNQRRLHSQITASSRMGNERLQIPSHSGDKTSSYDGSDSLHSSSYLSKWQSLRNLELSVRHCWCWVGFGGKSPSFSERTLSLKNMNKRLQSAIGDKTIVEDFPRVFVD